VELSVKGDKTLKQRVEMLREHKKNVEDQIQEMHQHLKKVTCKIEKISRQYKEYAEGLSVKSTQKRTKLS
jgi:prefoldin subunit 5